MKMQQIIHNKQFWDTVFNEDNYYTSKPSEEEIQLYKKLIKQYANEKNNALILGATASLRDICLELGFKTTIIDMNKNIVQKMQKYMTHKNDKNEKIIIKNWLDIDEENKYDLIIGDASFNNIPWDQYEKLLLIIRKALKKEGIFIHRQFVYNQQTTLRTPKEIIEEFRITWNLRNLKYNLRMNSILSWSDKWYNKQNFESYWEVYFDFINELFEKKLLTKDEFDGIYKEAHKIISVFPPIKLWEALLKKYVNIIDKQQAEEYTYTKYTPIYVAKVIP